MGLMSPTLAVAEEICKLMGPTEGGLILGILVFVPSALKAKNKPKSHKCCLNRVMGCNSIGIWNV